MKKNDSLILISAVLFSGLFYQQTAGINYFLFTLLASAAIMYFNSINLKDKKIWYYLAACNLSGAAVFIINSDLSIFTCIISTLVLSSKTLNKNNSVIFAGIFGFYSVASSFFHWIISLSKHTNENEKITQQNKWKILLSVVLSFFILILFFNLYKNANPLFSDFTKFINFKWLSFGWIGFTFLGFLIFYGLLHTKSISFFSKTDLSAAKDIDDNFNDTKNSNQVKIVLGFILFSVLNLMLVFLNGLDIHNLYISNKMPEGITLSDFVHQAVLNMVFSIILALSLIAWIFSGSLNYSVRGKQIRYLISAWLAQISIVVVNTILRNSWYIREYQLTYLRIGVYVFLCLCLIGLVLTYFKLSRHKSTWKLLNQNVEVWFFILIFASLFNWDKLITNYNIHHHIATKPLDKTYLLYLSDANIPELVELSKTKAFTKYEEALFIGKCKASHKKDRFRQWPSFNLRSYQNANAIKPLINN